MNSKLIYNKDNVYAVVIRDGKKEEISYTTQLPKILNLENTLEQISLEHNKIENKIENVSLKVASIYNTLLRFINSNIGVNIQGILVGVSVVGITILFGCFLYNTPVPFVFKFLVSFTSLYSIGFCEGVVSLQKYLSKKYGCKNLLSRFLNKFYQNRIHQLEKQKFLIQDCLQELSVYREEELSFAPIHSVQLSENSKTETIDFKNLEREELNKLFESLIVEKEKRAYQIDQNDPLTR